MKNIDWDDLRHVLALAQHQTMASAAHTLRVHQTTLSRRIAALEGRLRTRLFIHVDGRFEPTKTGAVVLRRAQEMELAALALNDELTHDPDQGQAVVRLSVIQTFVTGFLASYLDKLSTELPDIQLELICENRDAVLEHREADIAIRYVRPAHGQCAVRKMGELGSAAYAHKSLLGNAADWHRDIPWIGFAQVADRWPEYQWIENNIPPERVLLTVNGGPAYTDLVARGYGAGLLTCIEGDARQELQRLSGPDPIIVREIWLLVLPELRRNAAVRKVIDWLAQVTRLGSASLLGSGKRTRASGLASPS